MSDMTQPTKGEPVAFTATSLESKWNSVHWRAGLPFPPVGYTCEVSGVNTDKSCDQERTFTKCLVVAITPCRKFICLQKEGCWPTIERLENCWFRVADIRKWSEPVAGTATPPAINTNVRLFDLVRFMRSELHQAGLITDDEYTWLCALADMAKGGGSPSPRRLEDYDELQSRLTLAREKIAVQEKEIAEARNDLTGNLWSKWEIERAQTIGELATARASLAAVTAKMKAIAHEVENAETRQHHVLVATLRSIITQEEGK